MKPLSKALYLGLDGTLIKTKSGKQYPQDKNDWQIAYDDAIGKIHQYKAKGYTIIIVANQGPLETNFMPEADVHSRLFDIRNILQRPGTKKEEGYIHIITEKEGKYICLTCAGKGLNVYNDESIMIGGTVREESFARRQEIGEFILASDFFKKPSRRRNDL